MTPAALLALLLAVPAEPVVVVELFTSQGCSSCPPADRLLGELAAISEIRVIPLSFHVDYWNYIGWQDPFSSKRWSQRQEDYARAFESGRVYTPQLVIAGAEHLVGSDEREVRAGIRRAANRPPQGEVEIVSVEIGAEAGSLDISLRARVGAGIEDGEVYVALFEKGLETPVARGENRGRQLHNDFVVREWKRVAEVDQQLRELRVELPLEPSWKLEALGVAAIAQNRPSMEILAADAADL